MNISGVQDLLDLSIYSNSNSSMKVASTDTTSGASVFESIFDAALKQMNETDSLINTAEEEEIKFALGLSDSTHQLQIAQAKASMSLSYTVSLRKTVLDSYKEIMNLQF